MVHTILTLVTLVAEMTCTYRSSLSVHAITITGAVAWVARLSYCTTKGAGKPVPTYTLITYIIVCIHTNSYK